MLKKRVASFWLNAMFYTMLQRVSLFIFGVVAYMILVRGFSTAMNGVWALYISLFSLLEAVKQGLIRNSTIRFLGLAVYKNRNAGVQSASLVLNILFSVFAVILIFFCGQFLSDLLKARELFVVLAWSSFIIALLIPYNHCEILLQSRFQFEILFKAAFLRQGIFFFGIVLLYAFLREYFSLLNVLLVQFLSLLISCSYIVRASHTYVPAKLEIDRDLILELFRFGRYTFGTNLFAGLSRSFDHLITASVLGPVYGKNYVAYYNTVARINNMVDVPSLAAADVLYPKNVEALEKEGHGKVRYYFEQVTGTILAFIVPLSLFIFLFPQLIIDVIAGPQYYPAAVILQLTILFSMVRPLSYQFGSTLDAIGHPEINFRANVALTIFNLLLTYFFLKYFGGMGAAYAAMIYYSVSLAVMLLILKKYIRVSFRNIIRYWLGRYKGVLGYLHSKLR